MKLFQTIHHFSNKKRRSILIDIHHDMRRKKRGACSYEDWAIGRFLPHSLTICPTMRKSETYGVSEYAPAVR